VERFLDWIPAVRWFDGDAQGYRSQSGVEKVDSEPPTVVSQSPGLAFLTVNFRLSTVLLMLDKRLLEAVLDQFGFYFFRALERGKRSHLNPKEVVAGVSLLGRNKNDLVIKGLQSFHYFYRVGLGGCRGNLDKKS
jgi:hypothetical protein